MQKFRKLVNNSFWHVGDKIVKFVAGHNKAASRLVSWVSAVDKRRVSGSIPAEVGVKAFAKGAVGGSIWLLAQFGQFVELTLQLALFL